MAIAVTEAVKAGKGSKAGKKVVAHIEIHPVLGGGHMVKHVYSGYQHEPTEHKFNGKGYSQGGKHIMNHLKEHAGLPMPSDAEEERDEEKVSPGIHKKVAKMEQAEAEERE